MDCLQFAKQRGEMSKLATVKRAEISAKAQLSRGGDFVPLDWMQTPLSFENQAAGRAATMGALRIAIMRTFARRTHEHLIALTVLVLWHYNAVCGPNELTSPVLVCLAKIVDAVPQICLRSKFSIRRQWADFLRLARAVLSFNERDIHLLMKIL